MMTSFALAQFPPVINYQGRLLDSDDKPITKSVEVVFSIYDSETDGKLLWTETHTLQADDGYINVFLGSKNPIEYENTVTDMWLEVAIDGGTISGRTQFTAVPWAFHAATADTAKYALTQLGEYEFSGVLDTEKKKNVEIKIAGTTAATYIPGDTAASMRQGYAGNIIDEGVEGSSILGGGRPGAHNRIAASYSTIAGGCNNVIGDTTTKPRTDKTDKPQYGNYARRNSFIGGGHSNSVSMQNAGVICGILNHIHVFRNEENYDDITSSLIGTGYDNIIKSSQANFIGTGRTGKMSGGEYNAILNGYRGTIDSGRYQVIVNGYENKVLHTELSTILGGVKNVIGKNGFNSVILNGYYNRADAKRTLVAGSFAKALHDYSMIFHATADSGDYDNNKAFFSSKPAQFLVKANGGIGFNTNVTPEVLNVNGAILIGENNEENAGTIRFKDGAFEGYNGESWLALSPEGIWQKDGDVIRSSNSGIIRYNNQAHGNRISTHINLASGGTTGAEGSDYAFCTIGGGYLNGANASKATVAGGMLNIAEGDAATVGGGNANRAAGNNAVVAGGSTNKADENNSAVLGGYKNEALGEYSIIGGGNENIASAEYTIIGGGDRNKAQAVYSSVLGGLQNEANGLHSIVAGGIKNKAVGSKSTVLGGEENIAGGINSVVSGGYKNEAAGDASAIPGGSALKVGNNSFGFKGGLGNPMLVTDVSSKTNAFHVIDAHFIFNDSREDADFIINGSIENLFFADASENKIGIGTNEPATKLDIDGAIKIGQSATTAQGAIRYQDGKFEGRTSDGWKQLDNTSSSTKGTNLVMSYKVVNSISNLSSTDASVIKYTDATDDSIEPSNLPSGENGMMLVIHNATGDVIYYDNSTHSCLDGKVFQFIYSDGWRLMSNY
ncbi:MAG: hypothetical protein ACLFQX_05200 [Candidatus Kapaibacterium sp.]